MATIFVNVGCSKNVKSEYSLQKIYGADANYFIGLKESSEHNYKSATRHFDKAILNGSKYVKRRSFEQKLKIGNIQEQINQAKKYLEFYHDDEAILLASQIFFNNQEYALVINSTNSIDLKTCPNALAKIRLLSMQKKIDSRLSSETLQWFIGRKISQEHIDFYNEFLLDKISSTQLDFINPVEPDKSQLMKLNEYNSKLYSAVLLKTIQFRILCATRNYSAAYDLLEVIKQYCIKEKLVPLTQFLVTDIGKIYYTISRRYWQNANFFLELSESEYANNPDIKYFSLLYAGRIFDKSGIYISKTEAAFEDAMKNASSKENYDMALWFLLNSKLAISLEDCVETLEKYCSSWNNPYYFSDFLDNFSLLIFTRGSWNLFPKVYKIIDGHADNVSTSKFAYLTGRLIDKNILRGTQAEKVEAYKKVVELNAGTDIYYRVLAARELNLPLEEFEKIIFAESLQEPSGVDKDAEIFLKGLADFGFVDLIYSEWQKIYSQNPNAFSLETILSISKFLKSCGSSENKYFYQSLHIISKTANLDNMNLTKEVFSLSYPKNFKKEIEHSTKEFGVEEYAMFGLIRTESFFNPIIESNKGALGLSQLMYPTFEECVKKLNIENGDMEKVDITNPALNVRVGTYYYSNLVKRFNNSDILALFAYNAGATKVRRWLATSKIGLGIYKNLPSDLFLETIPISETRNYGRKVIQSAAVYAWLYYNKSPYDVISDYFTN